MAPYSKRKRVLVSLFILFNAAAILNSSSRPRKDQNILESFFSPYLVWTRLNQRWLLFTPEPRHVAMRYYVQVDFKNGGSENWRRPYPPNWDFFERHLAYQYQKWDLASDYIDSNKLVQKDLVHFLKANFYRDESNPPIRMKLVKEIAPWPAPNPSGYVRIDDDQLVWNQKKEIFNYDLVTERFL